MPHLLVVLLALLVSLITCPDKGNLKKGWTHLLWSQSTLAAESWRQERDVDGRIAHTWKAGSMDGGGQLVFCIYVVKS